MPQFEWDLDKALTNQQKHGVAFADAVTALEDDYALNIEHDHPGERHFITLGMDALSRLLVVVYTYRGENIRSFRLAEQPPGNARNMRKDAYESGV
jgi:uncharacterized DUF497 family protein